MRRLPVPRARGLGYAMLLGLLVLPVAPGCKRKAPDYTPNSSLFQASSADTKALWDEALAALQTNGNVEAYVRLRQLRREPGMTEAQIQAVDAQCKHINETLSAAAMKGDTNARQALDDIHAAARMRH